MALNAHPGVRMFLSLLATAAAALAALLLLANLLMSGAYAGRVPGGDAAMGLVVPVFCAIAAVTLLLVATGLLIANGRLDWLGARGGWTAILVMLGVGIAAVAVLIAWMERMGPWVMPLGLFSGGIAPAFAVVLLIASAWRDGSAMQEAGWTRIGLIVLVASALCGMAIGLWGGAREWQRRAENAERAHVEQEQRNLESARRDALSAVDRLREDYAGFSPDAPLWVFIAGLPDPTEADLRDFIIARALQVPSLDAQLAQTITDAHPRYRHGASEFVRHAPAAALNPAWAAAVAGSMHVTAMQIAANPDWLVPDDFSNPDPLAHIPSLVAAAARFPSGADAQAASTELRMALSALPAGAARDQALAAFAAP